MVTQEDKLDSMRHDISEIKEMMIRFEAVGVQVKELRDTTYGNGNKGLKERMTAQEAACKAKTDCKPPTFFLRVLEKALANMVSVIAVGIMLALFWQWVGTQIAAAGAVALKP